MMYSTTTTTTTIISLLAAVTAAWKIELYDADSCNKDDSFGYNEWEGPGGETGPCYGSGSAPPRCMVVRDWDDGCFVELYHSAECDNPLYDVQAQVEKPEYYDDDEHLAVIRSIDSLANVQGSVEFIDVRYVCP